MNIVKFRDTIIPGDVIFNTYFKGKYVYAINWKYLAQISGEDGITQSEYIELSRNDDMFNYESDDSDFSSDMTSDDVVSNVIDTPDVPEESIGSDDFEDELSSDEFDDNDNEVVWKCPCCCCDDSDEESNDVFKVTFKDFINGTYTVLDSTATHKGDAFTFSVFPESGYEIYRVMVNDTPIESNCNVFTFEVEQDSEIKIEIIRINVIGKPVLIYDDYIQYIDIEKTEKANDVSKFICLNKFCTDDDITEDEVRMFRKWLASMMLELTPEISDMQRVILSYYANDMVDSTTIAMTFMKSFSPRGSLYNANNISGCGCSSLSQTSASLLALFSAGNKCDPLVQYRAMIHEVMVDMFSKVDTWEQYDEFLLDIIRYLKAILKLNLPLYGTLKETSFADCGMLTEKEAGQKHGVEVIRNLINAFEFISNGEASQHKNFIATSLYNWADKLYELMRW